MAGRVQPTEPPFHKFLTKNIKLPNKSTERSLKNLYFWAFIWTKNLTKTFFRDDIRDDLAFKMFSSGCRQTANCDWLISGLSADCDFFRACFFLRLHCGLRSKLSESNMASNVASPVTSTEDAVKVRSCHSIETYLALLDSLVAFVIL